jgi:hypothetical protein
MRYEAYGMIHITSSSVAHIESGIVVDHTQCSSEKK